MERQAVSLLMSLCWLIVVAYQSHHRGVIRRLDVGITIMRLCTVIGIQGIELQTYHTALGGPLYCKSRPTKDVNPALLTEGGLSENL